MEYAQLKLKFVDDVQERYESIRPIVLFEDVSIKKRAKEIGYNTKTIRKRVKRFKKYGMLGLFDFKHFPTRIKGGMFLKKSLMRYLILFLFP